MLERSDILRWLTEADPARLDDLYHQADETRRRNVGQAVHLRGLIEFGNVCSRRCLYCGLRSENSRLQRYRMSGEEILTCARQARQFGYGTVVLQSGEDASLDVDALAETVRQIKAETHLAVTLSVGEQPAEVLELWRTAGADRYLLRFETSNRELFDRIHPPRVSQPLYDRIGQLKRMRAMGYEIGSGVMVGIPGQTWDDLADDVELFAALDLDMIGLGPFIAHPDTPAAALPAAESGRQVPATEEITYRMVALARLACPRANIPSTTALATLNLATGRELGLQRGANVVMPNLTPPQYRALYEIYPAKACIHETASDCHTCMTRRIEAIGRSVATGPGASPRYIQAAGQPAS